MKANLCALAAIGLWASLAALGVSLKHVPPFLLTGIALIIGSALSWPFVFRDRQLWRVTPGYLALGVLTLFGYHFFLFVGLRLASAVEVNLINYLWPLLIVLLAPLYLVGVKLRGTHFVAAMLGFAGAATAILGGGDLPLASVRKVTWEPVLGYLLALTSAFIWANYSLQTKRAALAGRGYSSVAIGLFGLLSGLASLLCHAWLEPSVSLSARDGLLVLILGLGPLGAAFFLWDKALKLGDVRHIGVLSYLTPLASTVLLLLATERALAWNVALAAALIIGGALLGTRKTGPQCPHD
jgi:drug/metabolite transporter (DMT)-like permease